MKATLEFNLPTEIDLYNLYNNLPNIIKCLDEIDILIFHLCDNARAKNDPELITIYTNISMEISRKRIYYKLPNCLDPREPRVLFDPSK